MFSGLTPMYISRPLSHKSVIKRMAANHMLKISHKSNFHQSIFSNSLIKTIFVQGYIAWRYMQTMCNQIKWLRKLKNYVQHHLYSFGISHVKCSIVSTKSHTSYSADNQGKKCWIKKKLANVHVRKQILRIAGNRSS